MQKNLGLIMNMSLHKKKQHLEVVHALNSVAERKNNVSKLKYANFFTSVDWV